MENWEQKERIVAEENLKNVQGEILLLFREYTVGIFGEKEMKKFTDEVIKWIKEFNKIASSQGVDETIRIKIVEDLSEEIINKLIEYGLLGIIDEESFARIWKSSNNYLGGLMFHDDDLFIRFTDRPGETNEERKTYWTLVEDEESGRAYSDPNKNTVYARYRNLLDQGVVTSDQLGNGAGAKIEVFHNDRDYSGIIERDENP